MPENRMMQQPMYSPLKQLASRPIASRLPHIISTKTFVLLALSCTWVLMVFVVNPSGDFPLNDDWSYGLAVKTLLEEGRLHLIDWIATTAVTQIFWGALFCLPFGFSFTALRASSLVFGIIGVLATYGLLRETKAPRPVAFLGAVILATNPLYFELSNTFMTDVPFLAIAMSSFLMFIRGMRRNRQSQILAGALLACVATLIRQVGFVIPLSFALAYLVLNDVRPRAWISAAYPTLLGIVTLLIFQLTQGFSNNYGHVDLPSALHMSLGSLLTAFAVNGFIALSYTGLFLLPFLLLRLPVSWSKLSFRGRLLSVLIFAGFCIGLLGLLIWQGRSMPFLPEHGNLLMKSGLGPTPLRDSYLEIRYLPNIPGSLWWAVTAASALGAGLLLATLFLAARQIDHRHIKADSAGPEWNLTATKPFHRSLIVFLGSACILYFAPMGITGFYDRYLIPLLPLLMSLVALATMSIESPIRRWQVLPAAFLLVVYMLFTLGAAHDYFSWNRARWDALHYLMGQEMRISSQNIDGGYEFNGWYNYDAHYQASPEKSSWWVENDDYVVAFGIIPGYQVIRQLPYEKWIPFGQGHIFILHRTGSAFHLSSDNPRVLERGFP